MAVFLLNACSLNSKYVFPDAKSNQNSNKIFEEKRIPEYNPGGERFYENRDLFAQFMKDQKVDESTMQEKYGFVSNDKIKYPPNLLDIYLAAKETQKKRGSVTRPNLYDEYIKFWFNSIKNKNDPENFIVDGIDLMDLEGAYSMMQTDILNYDVAMNKKDLDMESKLDNVLRLNVSDQFSEIPDNDQDIHEYLIDDDDEDEESDDDFDILDERPYQHND